MCTIGKLIEIFAGFFCKGLVSGPGSFIFSHLNSSITDDIVGNDIKRRGRQAHLFFLSNFVFWVLSFVVWGPFFPDLFEFSWGMISTRKILLFGLVFSPLPKFLLDFVTDF